MPACDKCNIKTSIYVNRDLILLVKVIMMYGVRCDYFVVYQRVSPNTSVSVYVYVFVCVPVCTEGDLLNESSGPKTGTFLKVYNSCI